MQVRINLVLHWILRLEGFAVQVRNLKHLYLHVTPRHLLNK
jgi:hypothetical protein